MKIALTDELRKALDEHPGEPLELVDEQSAAKYVVVQAEVYERIRSVVEQKEQSGQESRLPLTQNGLLPRHRTSRRRRHPR